MNTHGVTSLRDGTILLLLSAGSLRASAELAYLTEPRPMVSAADGFLAAAVALTALSFLALGAVNWIDGLRALLVKEVDQ